MESPCPGYPRSAEESVTHPPSPTQSHIDGPYLEKLRGWKADILALDIDSFPDANKRPGWRHTYRTEIVSKIDEEITRTEAQRTQYQQATAKILAILSPRTVVGEAPIPLPTLLQVLHYSNRLLCTTLEPEERNFLSMLTPEGRSELRTALKSLSQTMNWSAWLKASGIEKRERDYRRHETILQNPEYCPWRSEDKESAEYKEQRKMANDLGNTADATSEERLGAVQWDESLLKTFRKYSEEGFHKATQFDTMLSWDHLDKDTKMGWQLLDTMSVASRGRDSEPSLNWHPGSWNIQTLSDIGRQFRVVYPQLTQKYLPNDDQQPSQRQNKIANKIVETVNHVVHPGKGLDGCLSSEASAILISRIARGASEGDLTFPDGTTMQSAPSFVESLGCNVTFTNGPEDWVNMDIVED